MEDSLLELMNSEVFKVLESNLIISFEETRMLALDWLNSVGLAHSITNSEIIKINREPNLVQYSLDFILLDKEIDSSKGNWLGCLVKIHLKKGLINIAGIIHSVYTEVTLIDISIRPNYNSELERILPEFEVFFNKLPQAIIEILTHYLTTMGLR